MTVCVGVDGCKGGWIAVWRGAAQVLPELAVFPDFRSLTSALPLDAVIAVDMPIGLPETGTPGGRPAERAVRPLLHLRKSSVFSMPSREAVYAEMPPFAKGTYRQARGRALEVARRTSSTGSISFPILSFGIFPKIQEIDRLLRETPVLLERVFESHPEVAFRELNGKKEMQHSKLTAHGQIERRAALYSQGIADSFLQQRSFNKAKTDDFLDACVLLLVAERIRDGKATSHPSPPDRDAHGLPIGIWT